MSELRRHIMMQNDTSRFTYYEYGLSDDTTFLNYSLSGFNTQNYPILRVVTKLCVEGSFQNGTCIFLHVWDGTKSVLLYQVYTPVIYSPFPEVAFPSFTPTIGNVYDVDCRLGCKSGKGYLKINGQTIASFAIGNVAYNYSWFIQQANPGTLKIRFYPVLLYDEYDNLVANVKVVYDNKTQQAGFYNTIGGQFIPRPHLLLYNRIN